MGYILLIVILLFIHRWWNKPIGEDIEKLGKDILENFNDYHFSDCTLTGKGIYIWHANTIFDFKVNGAKTNISEKIYLKNCIKKSVIKKALNNEQKK